MELQKAALLKPEEIAAYEESGKLFKIGLEEAKNKDQFLEDNK